MFNMVPVPGHSGMYLPEGVTYEAHQRAMAGNYTGDDGDYAEDQWEREQYDKHVGVRTALVGGRRTPLGVWRTKAGERIPYHLLGDKHLKNCLAMLRRNADQQVVRLIKRFSKFGGMSDAAEEGMTAWVDRVGRGNPHERAMGAWGRTYTDLVLELRLRRRARRQL